MNEMGYDGMAWHGMAGWGRTGWEDGTGWDGMGWGGTDPWGHSLLVLAGARMVTTGTQCWAQGSSAGPAPALATPAHGTTTAAPAMLMKRPTTLSASVRLDTLVRGRAGTVQWGPPSTGTAGSWCPWTLSPQDPAVTAAPLGTSGCQRRRGEHAGPASATTISTPATQEPVTPTRGTACAACTTPPGPAAPTASLAITAMPCSVAAGVSRGAAPGLGVCEGLGMWVGLW